MRSLAAKYPFMRWWQTRLILLFLALALLSPLLSNDLPLYAKVEGTRLFPALRMLWDKHHVATIESSKGSLDIDYTRSDWRLMELQAVVWPLIPYSAKNIDAFNRSYKSPWGAQTLEKEGEKIPLGFRLRHYLGTDSVGRDIAAGMLSGLRISLGIGFLAILFAAVIALMFGSLSGYFGDYLLRFHPSALGLSSLLLLLPAYTALHALPNVLFVHSAPLRLLAAFFFLLVLAWLFVLLYRFFSNKISSKRRYHFPLDSLISRFTEIFDSLPKFLLILTLAVVIGRSVFWVALVIGLNGWASISRLLRAEVLKNRNMEYTQAALSSGMRHLRVLFRHVVPNAIGPFLVSISLGIGTAIIFESNLSFLGLGLPVDNVSWGSMIYQGKNNMSAWWLLLFPTLAIFTTIYTFNSLAERIRKND